MYSNLTNFAEGIDRAFLVILGIIVILLVSITITMIIFIFKYREDKHPKPAKFSKNLTLEIIWTVIPIGIVLGMFYFGWIGFKPMYADAPDDAMQINTTARMWSWMFEYENGRKTDTLYIPQGKPVKLKLNSVDVVHSLYIPAFRLKRDMVPGNQYDMWFVANAPGRYDLKCAEYCGLRHSYMYTSVVVMPQEKFEKWYADTTQVQMEEEATPARAGLQVMRTYGCLACHSLDGTEKVGPTYQGIYGKEVTVITDGEERTVTVDEGYIRRSIYRPDADIVEGFSEGQMQSYKGMVSEEEIDQIVAYLETLK
jgi:cytochrome c oxidase subunit 2